MSNTAPPSAIVARGADSPARLFPLNETMPLDRTPPLPESPAAERNKGPILAVLERVLPTSGLVLEVASGTGQHVVHFAGALPQLEFQPSDPDPASLEALGLRVARAGLRNIAPPISLDAAAPAWPVTEAAAVLCINMVHIAPWAAAEGLLRGAAEVLPPRGPLVLYGPFLRREVPTARSNTAFDASLRARDPDWGIRRLEDVTAAAKTRGFMLDELVEMPANNLIVVYRRS